MKQTKKSIIEACHGEIMEKADYALEQVLANINDINTDEKKKREIVIKMSFTPRKNREEIGMAVQVSTKLVPVDPTETTLFNVSETNKDTGEVVSVLKEITGQAPGQINFDGDIVEPEVFVIGMDAEKVLTREITGGQRA
ncbi:MAG: hypothetical protein HFF02_06680 [Erysipelotrichaceae bacterium]|nr:hypothetical protein [Erysipelotrichaceae bacterium]